jgi:hypothetical protein
MRPDGDFLGDAMGSVLANSASRLNDQDLQVIADDRYSSNETQRVFCASNFGHRDAVAQGDRSMAREPGIRLADVVIWLIWVIPMTGLVWSIFTASARKPAESNAGKDAKADGVAD